MEQCKAVRALQPGVESALEARVHQLVQCQQAVESDIALHSELCAHLSGLRALAVAARQLSEEAEQLELARTAAVAEEQQLARVHGVNKALHDQHSRSACAACATCAMPAP